MHVTIDARLAGATGVGRYIRNLVRQLALSAQTDRFTLLVRPQDRDLFSLPGNFGFYETGVAWHSLSEQLHLPLILAELRPDVIHIPYYNIPVFYRGPLVVTIHDLTILDHATGKASTLPAPVYSLKHRGFRMVLNQAVTRARKILTVSEAVRDDLVARYPAAAGKTVVTYEGIDPGLLKLGKQSGLSPVAGPYLLYVGNAYPHKNLEFLLDAFVRYQGKERSSLRLVLAGPDDYFYRFLKDKFGNVKNVFFYGPATDVKLAALYRHARAAVFPSLSEGFGLPPLEALSLGCPVYASDLPVFREILGPHARFFPPTDERILRQYFGEILRGVKKVPVPPEFFRRYSWKILAGKTLQSYREAARS